MSKSRRGIASWAISHPIGTLMLTSTLLVLGAVYIGRLPVDLLPRIVYPQVLVNVSNPGVEPVVLEETVAKPLESALATVDYAELQHMLEQDKEIAMNCEFCNTTYRFGPAEIESLFPDPASPTQH